MGPLGLCWLSCICLASLGYPVLVIDELNAAISFLESNVVSFFRLLALSIARMHSQRHCNGGGDAWAAWRSQTFAQLAHQHGQSIAHQYSDVPPSNEQQTSDALKHKLAEENLLAMGVLLRAWGIRTLRALESLETTERAVLRELVEELGTFPRNLKNALALNKLFGDVPQQGMPQGSSWDMQPGTMPYMYPQWSGHGGWGHLYELAAKERYAECLRRLERSNELVASSSLEVKVAQVRKLIQEWDPYPFGPLIQSDDDDGRPMGSKKLMSELQTKREFNVDAGCVILLTSLSGEDQLQSTVKESTPFTLLSQVLLRIMIRKTRKRLRVRQEVLEESGCCKIQWQELSPTSLCGSFILAAISESAYAKLYNKMDNYYRNRKRCLLSDACFVCMGPCEDADEDCTVASRLGNCVRCTPCYLCPRCKVIVNGQPVCYHCIDWEKDTLVLPDDVRQRIAFLGGAD